MSDRKNILYAVKNEFRIRKAIALALLAAAGAFLILNVESLYYTTQYYNGKNVSKNKELYYEVKAERRTEDNLDYAELNNNTILRQEFVAKESKIRDIRLLFSNKNTYEAAGSIEISLEDPRGESLAKTKLEASHITDKQFFICSFIADSDLYNGSVVVQEKNQIPAASDGINVKKGEKYILSITCEGINVEDELAIALIQHESDGKESLELNGAEYTDKSLFCQYTYSIFSYSILVFFIAVLLFTALLAVVPWTHLSTRVLKTNDDHKADLELWLQRLTFAVTPALCFWMNYKITDNKLSEIAGQISTDYGRFNLILLILLLAILYLITNSKRVSAGLCTLLTAMLMISCYFLILFRDVPLRAADFSDFGTATDVAANYEFIVNKSLMWIVTMGACMIALNVSFKKTKGLGSKKRFILLACICLAGGGIYAVFSDPVLTSRYGLSLYGFNQTKQYKNKGYALGFAISFRDLHIDKPAGYTVEKAEKIARSYPSDKKSESTTVSERSPNIICIMNEAFSDLSVHGDLETNEDYMPFFRSLEENTVKGKMHVSTIGGGTSSTEYAFLTGNTNAFLQYQTAYTSLIKEEEPSLAQTLKDQGYKGIIAFHPGKKDSYNRDRVYPFFGFEEFISIEDLNDPEMIRQYVSDRECYKTIIEKYNDHKKGKDADAPFFLFNVTIQNHGGFAYSHGVVDSGIEITDPELKMERAEQYLNLIKESDTAFEELINYYKDIKEPTVIVMFGDHQPGIEGEFYGTMAGRADENLSEAARTDLRYQVPFVIWANYDIEEEKDIEVSDSMLAAYMLNKLGLRMTGYDKFLLDFHKKIPSISAVAYYDSDGNAYGMNTDDEESMYMSEDILKYHYLQYNNMSKRSKKIKGFFTLSE